MTQPAEITRQARARVEANRLNLDVRHTQQGIEVLPTFNNVLIYCGVDENLKKLFQFNIFSSRVEVSRMPPWGDLGECPRSIKNADVVRLKKYLVDTYHVEFSMNILNEAINCEASCNAYDPVRDYLTNLKWDGEKRIGSWLTEYLGVDATAYTSHVGMMTLVAACARIDKPGIKYDYMLILEGEQDIGKSYAIKILGGPYYREISMTERDKDTVERMQGAWIIEVAELAVFKKKDIESLKAFITCSEDAQRLPYEHRSEIFPRRNIFMGTINPDNNGYLSDTTGNRRFLPVACGTEFKLKELARDRDQLWAEAWQVYRGGFPLFIDSKSEIGLEARARQAYRQTTDEWQEVIAEYVQHKDRVRGIDIWTECLKGFSSDFDRFRQIRVADIMTKLGWQKGVFRFEGRSQNGYHRKDPKANVTGDTSQPWEG